MMHKKAEADYQRGMKYKEIAEKYGVSLNTVKSWKQRHGWERKKGAHKNERVHTKKPGAPKGNKNAVGNRGGPGGPPRNDKAVKHGLFQKYLPAESLAIMEQLQQSDPLDIVWENIMIQYTAIIRAQRIMHVTDKGEMIKELKKQKFEVHTTKVEGETKLVPVVIEEEHEFQFAWDRQATFLQAQSRAMATLQSMIRQYEDMLRNAPPSEVTDERQLRIAKLRGEVALINQQVSRDDDKPIEIRIVRKGERE